MKKILILCLILCASVAISQPKTGTVLFNWKATAGTPPADSNAADGVNLVLPSSNAGYGGYSWSNGSIHPGRAIGTAPDTVNGYAGLFMNYAVPNTLRHLRIVAIIDNPGTGLGDYNVDFGFIIRKNNTSTTGTWYYGTLLSTGATSYSFRPEAANWGNIYNSLKGCVGTGTTYTPASSDSISVSIDSVRVGCDSLVGWYSRSGSYAALWNSTDTTGFTNCTGGTRLNPSSGYYGIIGKIRSYANSFKIRELIIYNTASTQADTNHPVITQPTAPQLCRGAGDSSWVNLTVTATSGDSIIVSKLSGKNGTGSLGATVLTSRDTSLLKNNSVTLQTRRYKFPYSATSYVVYDSIHTAARNGKTTDSIAAITVPATVNPAPILSLTPSVTSNYVAGSAINFSASGSVSCGVLSSIRIKYKPGFSSPSKYLRIKTTTLASDTCKAGDTVLNQVGTAYYIWAEAYSDSNVIGISDSSYNIIPISSPAPTGTVKWTVGGVDNANVDSSSSVVISGTATVSTGTLSKIALKYRKHSNNVLVTLASGGPYSQYAFVTLTGAETKFPLVAITSDTVSIYMCDTTTAGMNHTDSSVFVVKSVPVATPATFWKTAYWPTTGYSHFTPEYWTANNYWNRVTHIIIFNSGVSSTSPYFPPRVTTTDSITIMYGNNIYNGTDYLVRLITQAHAHGVKVLLGIGTGNATWQTILGDSTKADLYWKTFISFLIANNMDGYDLDWETNYTAAILQMNLRLSRKYLNTMPSGHGVLAVAAGRYLYAGYDTAWCNGNDVNGLPNVDQLNIQSYDMHRPWEGIAYSGPYFLAGFNAPLHPYPASKYSSYMVTAGDNYDGIMSYNGGTVAHPAWSLRAWIDRGFKRSRLGYLFPMNGYIESGVSGPGLPQVSSGAAGTFIEYQTIIGTWLPRLTYNWEDSCKVPYLTGTYSGTPYYITYEDTNSMKLKAQYALNDNVGGVGYFTLEHGNIDGAAGEQQPLLKAANDVITSGVVIVTAPPAPTLLLPANNATSVTNSQPSFSWNVASGATSYGYQLAIDTTTPTLVTNASVTGIATNARTLPANVSLSYNTPYYWRVNATNSGGTSSYSGWFKFTTQLAPADTAHPSAPINRAPIAGATSVAVNPTLAWSLVSGAASYNLQYGTDSVFGTGSYTAVTGITDTTYPLTTVPLAYATKYYFRAQAVNAVGAGNYSTVTGFTTLTQIVAPPPTQSSTGLVVRVRGTDQRMTDVDLSGLIPVYGDDATALLALPPPGSIRIYWCTSCFALKMMDSNGNRTIILQTQPIQ